MPRNFTLKKVDMQLSRQEFGSGSGTTGYAFAKIWILRGRCGGVVGWDQRRPHSSAPCFALHHHDPEPGGGPRGMGTDAQEQQYERSSNSKDPVTATLKLKQTCLWINKDPVPYIRAELLPSNILVWCFVI